MRAKKAMRVKLPEPFRQGLRQFKNNWKHWKLLISSIVSHKDAPWFMRLTLTYYPPEEQETLLMDRRRPRRQGKPLV